jgi:hypothetical protein
MGRGVGRGQLWHCRETSVDVGESVTALCHADNGYHGGTATAYYIWGSVLASVMDLLSSHTLAF